MTALLCSTLQHAKLRIGWPSSRISFGIRMATRSSVDVCICMYGGNRQINLNSMNWPGHKSQHTVYIQHEYDQSSSSSCALPTNYTWTAMLKTVSHIVLFFCLLSAKCLLAVSVGKRVQVRIRDETHLFIYWLQLPGWLGSHAILYCQYKVIHNADTRDGLWRKGAVVSVPGIRWRQRTNAEFRQGTKSIKRLHFIALSFGSWYTPLHVVVLCLSSLHCETDHQNNPNWSTTT